MSPVTRAGRYLLACAATGSDGGAEGALARDVLALARAMGAVARALDPMSGCISPCARIEGDEYACDCGYVEACADPAGFLRAALGRES